MRNYTRTTSVRTATASLVAVLTVGVAASLAQSQTPPPKPPPPATTTTTTAPPATAGTPQSQTPNGGAPAPTSVPLPPGYVIGPADQLSVLVWRNKDFTGDVVVRPDGKITMSLINDVQAAGLTPEELAASLTKALAKYQEDPNVTVVVREIRSRVVYITGAVGHSGAFPMTDHMTISNLISLAGGVADFGKLDHIVVIRREKGKTVSIPINFKELRQGKNLSKNDIELKPGDQVIVP
jgi:polysaccharide export outer membrane protein